MDRVEQQDGRGGIGKIYSYLRDSIPAGPSDYMMYTIHQRGGFIMHYFYEMSTAVATAYASMEVNVDFNIHLEFHNGIPLNELLTTEWVIKTQYQLGDA
jgi:hypothetical protein